MRNKITIGLICGGTSGEHEVSLISAHNIQASLDREKYEVLVIAIDKNGSWFLGEASELLENAHDIHRVNIKKTNPVSLPQFNSSTGENFTSLNNSKQELSRVDVFFPITHGKNGEDGSLQGFLELVGKPYVGADVYGSAICMDKDVTKRLLKDHNIPVSKYKLLRNPDEVSFEHAANELGHTLFVKPCREGSSIGISKVKNADEYVIALERAFSVGRKVLIEEEIVGREIECSVLGNNSPEASSVLGEIIPLRDFYSYDAKYLDDDGAELIIPAKIDIQVSDKILKAAKEAFLITECRGMARVDFFLKDDGNFVLNEINTLPGFTKISMFPKLWEASGLSYTELLDRLIELALE